MYIYNQSFVWQMQTEDWQTLSSYTSLFLSFFVNQLSSVSVAQLNIGTTLHGRDGKDKASFFSFGVGKMSERSFREKCLN